MAKQKNNCSLERARILKFVLVLMMFLCSPIFSQQLTCSAFVVNKNRVTLAKNLDWELGTGLIVCNPKGENKTSITKPNGKNWVSKYASITFNHFGKDFPLGGINEKGLVIEELSTYPVKYPKIKDKSTLNEFEWIQYNLDSFSSVKELIESLPETSIQKFYFDLHFIAADKSGDAAVIEFIDGRAMVFTDSLLFNPVLSNNNYNELLRYKDLYKTTGRKILDVRNSQERFLKIIELIKTKKNFETVSQVNASMNILDSVKVQDTRWSIVYDITNMNIYFKTFLNEQIKKISFDQFDLTNHQYFYDHVLSDSTINFKELSSEINNKYLFKLEDEIKNKFPANEGLTKKINTLIID
jgi:penicillin V acylase-like amidase (Ntn superfamily)